MKQLTEELKKLLFPESTILVGYRGSVAHNMYVPNTDPHSIDDIDLMGVYMAPKEYYIGLGRGRKQYARGGERLVGKYDVVNYEFRHFVNLLIKSNPNVLSLLWLKDNHYIKRSTYGKALIENRDLFSSKLAYQAFTGYAHGQLDKMESFNRQGYMGEKRKALVSKFGYDCYDEKTTEFLTNHGWKKFDDVNPTDKLGTVQPLTGEFEFQKYSSMIDKIYNGTMYVLEPYLSRCVVTPEHNLLVSPARRGPKNNYSNKYIENKSDWHLTPLQEVLDGSRSHYHIRRTVKPTNCIDYKMEDSYLQLAGLFLSDGTVNFRNKKVKSIRVTQSKNDNGFYSAIRHLMSIYSIKEYNYEKEDVWVLHGEVAKKIYYDFGHRNTKHLPTWILRLSTRQVDILWKNLLLGDGTKKDEYNVYYTSNKNLADMIQAMMVVSGNHCVVDGPYKSQTSYGISTQYHVVNSNIANSIHTLNFGRLLKHNEKPVGRNGYPIKELEVVDRRVVCFEVPNGTLVTRNNGKVSIHGNCKNAAHCIRLLRMGLEFLLTGELFVSRMDARRLLKIKLGEWKLEDVKAEANRLFELADQAYVKSTLPSEPDVEKIEELVMSVILNYISNNHN